MIAYSEPHTMRLIRIGRRIVNIARATDVELVRAGEVDGIDGLPATEHRCRIWFSNTAEDEDFVVFYGATARAAWWLLNSLVDGVAEAVDPDVNDSDA